MIRRLVLVSFVPLGKAVNMRVYSLLDRKLREYGGLVQANNGDAVKRALVDGLKGSNSLVEKHPEDFDLMEVGEFDTDTGLLSGTSSGVPMLIENVGALIFPPGEVI